VNATNDQVGYHNATVYIATNRTRDFDKLSTSIAFNVTNVNDPPNISTVYPSNMTPSTYENLSMGFLFNYSASDPDIPWGDFLHSEWYLDGVLVYNTTNHKSGNYTYYPSFCDAGYHNITLIVNDTGDLKDRRTWNLTVINVNRPPVFSTNISNTTWAENTNLLNNITLSEHFYDLDNMECTGSNKDTLTFGARGNSSIIFSIDQTSTNVSIYPKANWSGAERVFFYVKDGTNTTNGNNATFNVTNTNQPPSLAPMQNQTASVNVSYALQVSNYAYDADLPYGDSLTYSDNASIFDINPASGLISFIPSDAAIGNYTINISVTDSFGEMAYQLVHFEIRPNYLPVLEPLTELNSTQGVHFSRYINAVDLDGDNLIPFV